MPLEKAFAINANPSKVWDVLVSEFPIADEDAYEIEQTIINEFLALNVKFQDGIRAHITYRLIPHDDHTEVVATMHPVGLRYAVFKAITLGRADVNYELGLAVGLSNLKQAVEGGPTAGAQTQRPN